MEREGNFNEVDMFCLHLVFNPRRACAVRVTVVVVCVCLSFCLLCENSLLQSKIASKTSSHTQLPTEVRKYVGFSLKLLRCRARAFFCSYSTGNGGHFNNAHV